MFSLKTIIWNIKIYNIQLYYTQLYLNICIGVQVLNKYAYYNIFYYVHLCENTSGQKCNGYISYSCNNTKPRKIIYII